MEMGQLGNVTTGGCRSKELPLFTHLPLVKSNMILRPLIWLSLAFAHLKVSVVQNCMPSVKPWRAGQTSTLIQGLLFLAFLLCFVSVAYGVVLWVHWAHYDQWLWITVACFMLNAWSLMMVHALWPYDIVTAYILLSDTWWPVCFS